MCVCVCVCVCVCMHTVEEADSELELVVYNFDSSNAHKFVGSVVIRLQEIENGETTDEWYPLRHFFCIFVFAIFDYGDIGRVYIYNSCIYVGIYKYTHTHA